MSKLIHSEYHGEITINNIVRDVVICYSYYPDSFYAFVECAYTNKGIKSAMLKKLVENDLPIFMEEQARRDFDRLIETARDEMIDRREYIADMKSHERMKREAA